MEALPSKNTQEQPQKSIKFTIPFIKKLEENWPAMDTKERQIAEKALAKQLHKVFIILSNLHKDLEITDSPDSIYGCTILFDYRNQIIKITDKARSTNEFYISSKDIRQLHPAVEYEEISPDGSRSHRKALGFIHLMKLFVNNKGLIAQKLKLMVEANRSK